MTAARFTRSFTQQVPIPEEGIAAAVAVLQSGRLHRYNIADGEVPQAAALEREFADWQGSRYCLAVASGGQAMQIALRAAGVRAGDKVLTNAFTLAPVPGAIAAVGGEPVLVEITEDLVIDLDDLAAKASASGAGHLLLSNMRGHLCDMDRLMDAAAPDWMVTRLSGKARLNSTTARVNTPPARRGMAARLRRWPPNDRMFAAATSRPARPTKVRSTSSRKRLPSSVGDSRVPWRSNSGKRTMASNWPTRRLTWGCEVCRRRAASVIEPVCITARNTSMCLRVMRRPDISKLYDAHSTTHFLDQASSEILAVP